MPLVGGVVLGLLSLLGQTSTTAVGFRVYIDNVRLSVPLDGNARWAPLPAKPIGTYLVDVSAVLSDGKETARTPVFWIVTAEDTVKQWFVAWDWNPGTPTPTIRPTGKPAIVNGPVPSGCQSITPGVGQLAGPGGIWTIDTANRTLLNGVWVSNGLGTRMVLLASGDLQVLGTDAKWYRWSGSIWQATGAGSPCP